MKQRVTHTLLAVRECWTGDSDQIVRAPGQGAMAVLSEIKAKTRIVEVTWGVTRQDGPIAVGKK